MEASSIPAKFPTPWAVNAGPTFINPVPAASQISINPGFASLNDGFVPLNATPVAAGGIPPRIQDWNGILKESTSWDQWFQMGGPIIYDATFQGQIGGYPNGAVIQSAVTPGGFWRSTVDNNTTNPDTGGAGWVVFISPNGGRNVAVYQIVGGVQQVSINGAAFTTDGAASFTVPFSGFGDAELWGGGGGSGSTNSNPAASSGGGGGGYVRVAIQGIAAGTAIPITVGVGGVAGNTPLGESNGGNGGDTTLSLATPAVAGGGDGGIAGNAVITNTAAIGGTATGGYLNVVGGVSDTSFLLSNGAVYVGKGGTSFGTPATHGGSADTSIAGINGFFPGGGAGSSINEAAGGPGGNGLVIIRY
jgi:hypothetical protein